MKAVAHSFLFGVSKYEIKVIQSAMVCLFFIEIYKALPATEMQSCLRCSARAGISAQRSTSTSAGWERDFLLIRKGVWEFFSFVGAVLSECEEQYF